MSEIKDNYDVSDGVRGAPAVKEPSGFDKLKVGLKIALDERIARIQGATPSAYLPLAKQQQERAKQVLRAIRIFQSLVKRSDKIEKLYKSMDEDKVETEAPEVTT